MNIHKHTEFLLSVIEVMYFKGANVYCKTKLNLFVVFAIDWAKNKLILIFPRAENLNSIIVSILMFTKTPTFSFCKRL